MGLNYEIECQKIFKIQTLITRFVKTFSPQPSNY